MNDSTVESALLSFLGSPFGVVLIVGFILNIAMIIAFFVTAYNIGRIREDIHDWIEIEYPRAKDEQSAIEDEE